MTIYLLVIMGWNNIISSVGPEFKVKAECEAVVMQLDPVPERAHTLFDGGYTKRAKCIMIKKTL